MDYGIFLDDERLPPLSMEASFAAADKNLFVFRSFEEVTYYMENIGFPSFMSFDHDLGTGPTGMDVAHWMINKHLDGTNPLARFPDNFVFIVHSMNSVGGPNITNLLNSFLDFRKTKGK